MRIYSRDVRMYVCFGHAQECQFALALRNPGVTECFLAMEGGEDSVTGPSCAARCLLLRYPSSLLSFHSVCL